MKKITILTGAGISAESGISTFRDAGGLWETHKIEDVATPEAWHKNPTLVLNFYNERRKQLLNCKPNNAHHIIAELEQKYNVQIITQNVDNLHELAGSSKVLHLHGELMKVRSTGPNQEVYDVDIKHPDITNGDCCPNGYQLRPHIVWFGEEVPEFDNASRLTQQADILVIIGTSLQVYPAASLMNYSKQNIPIFLIDPNPPQNTTNKIQIIRKKASEGMKDLLEKLSELED